MRPTTLPDGAPGWDVVYYAPDRDRLDLTTVYLGPSWSAAEADLRQVSGEGGSGWLLDVEGPSGRQRVLHNPTAERLEAGGLATDGLAVTVRHSDGSRAQVCYVGGSEVQLNLATPPAQVVGEGVSVDWTWQDGMLLLHPVPAGAAGCVELQE
jgi:hypothetical protein